MHPVKRVMKSQRGAPSLLKPRHATNFRRVSGAGILFLAMASTFLWSATSHPQAQPAAASAVAVGGQAPGGNDYVGAETCATCHEAETKKFAVNPHHKLALEHGKNGVTCEGCHGPGREHVEGGGDKTKIFSFNAVGSQQASRRCLGCHAGTHPNYLRSPHAKADVGCTSCHSVHAPENSEDASAHLLKAAQPLLCFQCHTDTKPQFSMPFHHKVNEGVVNCTDCHDVHGTFLENNLRSTADQNAICTKCHLEKRGPFVYEHAPVKAEGCLACHTPHGSQNARLLTMPSINTLCNQCHSPVSAATVHGMNAGSSELLPCISCHTYIHGSNLNQAFIK